MHIQKNYWVLLIGMISLFLPSCSLHQEPGKALENSSPVPVENSGAGMLNGVTGVSGAMTLLSTPPASVELDSLTSDTEMFAFAEKQGHSLTINLVGEITQPGDYFSPQTPDSLKKRKFLSYGLVRAGTEVNAYYLHADNVTFVPVPGICQNQTEIVGSISFENEILALIFEFNTLEKSNAECGLAGVNYCEDRGDFPSCNVVTGCKTDRFQLSNDRKTLHFTSNSDKFHDNVRILTAVGD